MERIIVTRHAAARIKQRLPGGLVDPEYVSRKAYELGKEPPPSFRPDAAGRPEGFDSFVYRFYNGMTFVFGMRSGTAYVLSVYYATQARYKRSLDRGR